MYWVYIIKSKKNDSLYIGSTPHLGKRIQEHNRGKNLSTRRYLPWVLAYAEGYYLEEDAAKREEKLKQFGKVYHHSQKKN